MLRAARGPLLIVVLIALLLAGLWIWVRTTLPELQGNVELSGLANEVEIVRDEFGVPTIVAGSQEDLYFALGFVHAQDRLWQMEERRLRAAGRLASVLGEEALASDTLMRTLGLQQVAERDVGAMSARTVGTLQAYSDGINAFLQAHRGSLPLEFLLLGHTPGEWSPVDVVLIQKLTSWHWSGAASRELLLARIAAADDRPGDADGGTGTAALAELSLARILELLKSSGAAAAGGRAWAVAGDRSADGFPLLAAEVHGPLTAPPPWYLVRLRAPGVNLGGATLPGLPLVLSGRNESIAWALVPTPTDNQDLFVVGLVSNEGGEAYRSADGVREFASRAESVTVRGADDAELNVRSTEHGPVVSDLVTAADSNGRGPVLALGWTALEEGDGTVQAALSLATTSDWQEFRSALTNLDELPGTALYADVQGRIGQQPVGRRPLRQAGNGDLPTPGEEFDWAEWEPFAEGVLVPAGGELVAGGDGTAVTETALGSLGVHTSLSSARLLAQEYLPGVETLLPLLKATTPTSALAREAHARLVGWDGGLDAPGAAPLVYSAWLVELAGQLLADELGGALAAEVAEQPRLLQLALAGEAWCDDTGSAEVERCGEISSRALSEASDELARQYGPIDEWPAHPRAADDYRHPVFGDTLLDRFFRVARDPEATGDPKATGPVVRAIYEMTEAEEWAGSGFLIPTGESGNPLSPYYRNLSGRWHDARLVPLAPAADERTSLTLEPRR